MKPTKEMLLAGVVCYEQSGRATVEELCLRIFEAMDEQGPTRPVSLREHIDTHFDGNLSAFARAHGKHYQQAQQWIGRGAYWYAGDVWLPRSIGGGGASC